VTIEPENLPGDIAALTAALTAEREARQQAEARALSAEALVAHYKLVIAKLKREQYGQSSERGRKLLDQLELQLEEAAASAAEDEAAAAPAAGTAVSAFTRRKPVRAPFSAHLPRERVVVPAPKACPCCGGKLAKLGETDYMLTRWPAFTRFLDDGRICLSNNAAERALRGVALGRRSWLFAGSDRGGERAAAMYTLIATAKLNDIAPQAWLADVLARIADHPASRLAELLP
jgi:transposase